MKKITEKQNKAATEVKNILNERSKNGFTFKASFVANTNMGKDYHVFFDQMFSETEKTDSIAIGYSLDKLKNVRDLADEVEKDYKNSLYNLAFHDPLTKIEKLSQQVKEAKTPTVEGRQTVANNCKELYNTIEAALYKKYGEAAVKDAYADLCEGNFADPFLCEKKKEKFTLYYTVFINKIAQSQSELD